MERIFLYDPEDRKKFETEYNEWLKNVERWANQYGITLKQAIEILFENDLSSNKITAKELLKYADHVLYEYYCTFKGI